MTTFPDVVDEFPDATTLTAQDLDEADHAQLHENLGTAIAATQTFVAGVPRVLKFPFTYATPNLLTGAAVYTPTIDDLLMDAWVEIDTAWDGTTPKGDFGMFVGANYGAFGCASGGVDMTAADTECPPGFLNQEAASPVGTDLLLTGALNNTSTAWRSAPLKFTAVDPVKVCVSQDGTNTGADPGSTQGAAVLHLVVCTPADG